MAGAFSGMGGAAGAGSAAGGASGGGGLMSMLGGMGGGMLGGGDTATGKEGSKVHTQKIYGWDVPDLMRNALEMGRDEKPVGFERLLGQGSGAINPVKPTSTGSNTPMDIKNGGGEDLGQQLDLTTALLGKLANYEPMSSNSPQLPKNNFGLRLLSDEDLKL